MPFNYDSWKAVRMEFSPYNYYRTDFQLFLWATPRPGTKHLLPDKKAPEYVWLFLGLCKYYMQILETRNLIKITYLNAEYQIVVLFQISWVEKN